MPKTKIQQNRDKFYCKNCRFEMWSWINKVQMNEIQTQSAKICNEYYGCFAKDICKNYGRKLYKRKWWKFWA